ncbi:hypothetical protein EG830_06265 [bacterium]|nr:hypothetical protein [bacterium]
MKTVIEYKYVLAAVAVLAVLVLIRTLNPGIFRYDAVKWAEPSVTGGNIVSPDNLQAIGNDILFVILDADCQVPDMAGAVRLATSPGDLLRGENLRKIRKNKGPVVLCSEDISVSSRVWMVLSETGIRKLYILKKDPA